MLFFIQHNVDVFQLNPELKSIEEFARLTDRQMKYVILLTDYKSPFRKLTLEERKYQAALTAGYKLEKDGTRLDMNARNIVNDKVGNVLAGIKKYKELQRDEDYETLLSVNTLIADVRKFNEKADKTLAELEKAVNLTTGKLDKLIETKKKIEEILELREEPTNNPTDNVLGAEDDVVDEGSLSVLEKVNQGLM